MIRDEYAATVPRPRGLEQQPAEVYQETGSSWIKINPHERNPQSFQHSAKPRIDVDSETEANDSAEFDEGTIIHPSSDK